MNTLTELTDEDDNSVLDLLDRAVAANLLTEIGPGRFSFAHALVEHALYDELSATRRARLHRRVAEIIERQAHGRPGDRIGELAYHWGEAIEPQDSAKAIEFGVRPVITRSISSLRTRRSVGMNAASTSRSRGERREYALFATRETR